MKKSWLRALAGALCILMCCTGCMPPQVDSLSPMETLPVTQRPVTEAPTASTTPTPVPTASPTPTPTPTPVPTPEPFDLHTVLQGGISLPVVDHCPAKDAINSTLSAYYLQWGEWFAAAKRDGLPSSLSYTYILEDEYCRLSAFVSTREGAWTLPGVRFNRNDGSFDELLLPAHEGFAEADYLRTLIALSDRGYAVDWQRDPGALVTREQFFAQLLEAYTRITGEQVSAEGSELGNTATARAAILGLLTPAQARAITREADAGNETYGIEATYVVSRLAALYALIEEQRLGDPAEADAASLFNLAQEALNDWAVAADLKDEVAWQETMANFAMPEVLSRESQALKRIQAAELYVTLFEAAYGEIDEAQWSSLLDTDHAAARKAYGTYLMQALPGSRYFSPNYLPEHDELYAMTSDFVSGYTLRFGKVNPELSPQPLTYGAFLELLASCIVRWEAIPMQDYTVESVNNAREHAWYVNQYDGSPLAASNCMPAITCMALRWQDPTFVGTPTDVRALSASTAPAWKMRQVEEVLQKQDVEYYIHRLDRAKMLADLDEGCILLVQIHEGNLSLSGHCLVIYGYRKVGDHVTYLAHDPGFSTQTDLYGEPLGYEIERSAAYLELISARIASSYLAVRR